MWCTSDAADQVYSATIRTGLRSIAVSRLLSVRYFTYPCLYGYMDIRCYFHTLDYISIIYRYSLFVPLSKYMTVDHCFPSCLYRQLFTNDQAHSTLHHRQSHLDRSYISPVNYKVTEKISNRIRTQLYIRTGEISLQADLRMISSLCLLLLMTTSSVFVFSANP